MLDAAKDGAFDLSVARFADATGFKTSDIVYYVQDVLHGDQIKFVSRYLKFLCNQEPTNQSLAIAVEAHIKDARLNKDGWLFNIREAA